MNILFGLKRPTGRAVNAREIDILGETTKRYALDQTFLRTEDSIGVGIHANFTTERARLNQYPAIDSGRNILLFDGRLDNYDQLGRRLGSESNTDSDTSLVLMAFSRWGEDCFAQFVGDWALALWSVENRTLYLARDHAGTRTLYFESNADGITWATYLDTFFPEGTTRHIDEKFAARFLCSQSLAGLTPYKEIRSVPAAHYVAIRDGEIVTRVHWSCLARHTIRYHSDCEYEEHFLSLFRQSVERRTVPGGSILAQLSGGMDSSSIVCMSDHLRRSRSSPADILETVSFYDDSEPNWDERQYFTIVEAQRGKTGTHIDQSHVRRTYEAYRNSREAYLLPGADGSSLAREIDFSQRFHQRDFRVLLSGIGGDELLGGSPLPTPELGDYLVAGRLSRLVRQGLRWAMAKRVSLLHLLIDTVVSTTDLYRSAPVDSSTIPSWLTQMHRDSVLGRIRDNHDRERRIGFAPSSVYNTIAWWSILETQPHLFPGLLHRYEYRYPYLDRDLVDFLLRIPREQLIRPGRRRSLMRRALKSIVPEEILERRRKAYLVRGPLTSLQSEQAKITQMFTNSLSARCGLIDPVEFRKAFDYTMHGTDLKWLGGIVKTISLELWLVANSWRLTGMSTALASAERACEFIYGRRLR